MSHPHSQPSLPRALLSAAFLGKGSVGWPGQSAACPGFPSLRFRGTLRFAPATRAREAVALIVVLGVFASPAVAAEPAPAGPGGFIINLRNGGFVHGAPDDSARPGTFRWRADAFAEPLELGSGIVSSIHRLGPTVLPKPDGPYGFWLAGGDVLFGRLVSLGEDEAVLEVPRLGRLHVERRVVHRIERLGDGANLVYVGPNGLQGWRDSSRDGAWSEDSGQLSSNQEGASIHGDLGLPARASVEFEVSWKSKPDFVLALGVDGEDKNLQRAFRFEVWDGQLVIHRETDREADVAPLVKVANGPGRVHLLAYVDQEQGRIVVVSPQGKSLADMTVTGAKPQVFPGVHLANVRGDVRLERLRIARWQAEPTRSVVGDTARVHRLDGSVVAGRVRQFDAAADEFVVATDAGESRVAAARVANVFLSAPDDEPAERSVLVSDSGGSRLSGELTRVENAELCLAIPGIRETPRIPVSALRSLLVLHHRGVQPLDDRSTRLLELNGVRLFGSLADGRERPGASCLAWRTLGSDVASPLRPGVSGRIITNWWEPARAAAPSPQPARNQAVILRLDMAAPVASRPAPQPPSHPRALHLRTGDLIPAEITKIDEKGVWFKSSFSDNRFIAHDQVQAVDLESDMGAAARLAGPKRDRLLTLPRMQKDSPPTHLIGSYRGDYLRGRLLSMDDKTVQVEVRLEAKEIPRERVTRIIWLHPERADTPKPEAAAPKADAAAPEPDAPAAGPDPRTRVQAILKDGIRLTFYPDRLARATLSGSRDVLGTCHVGLLDVDRLLLGDAIEQEASKLAYGQWALRDAPEPKASTAAGEGGEQGGSDGTDSPLVGKPAPDFELGLLDGKTFRLSQARGKVVVLDFWATWCGPCVRAMPQVERVAREFRDRDVQLVAVNLQETEKQITSMLERHKLDVNVALDRDGDVARKYAANAIPQTVVIDREGKVVRLFIGASAQLEAQLRDAIQGLMPKGEGAEIRK